MAGNVENLAKQRKSCRVVVGIEGIKDGVKTRFIPSSFNLLNALGELSSHGFIYYCIKHDDDSEYIHYHLVLVSNVMMRFKQYLNIICECFQCHVDNVSIRETSNLHANIQYLIHKNESEDKHRYKEEEIFTNDSKSNLINILDEDLKSDILMTEETLYQIVKKASSPVEIFFKVGRSFYNVNYRSINMLMKNLHPDWKDWGII